MTLPPDDIDGLAVEYEWWKSNTVEGKSFSSQTSGSQQVSSPNPPQSRQF